MPVMDPNSIYSPGDIETLLAQICRDLPAEFLEGIRRRWPNVPEQEQAGDMKTWAVCRALARLDVLNEEIKSGRRASNGEIHVRV